MKKTILMASVCGCCLAAEMLLAAPAPAGAAAASKSAPAATATPRAEVKIPVSIFVWPHNPSEGKDPFFPNSKYPYDKPPTTQTLTNAPVTLTLNGITRGLAMINGRTFSEGEEGDVKTNSGKKRVRCLKIKEESVIIELLPEGERQELKLRGVP
jgi:hypothetical protein